VFKTAAIDHAARRNLARFRRSTLRSVRCSVICHRIC